MLAFLSALAEALPAAGKLVDSITHHDDKASTAAKVAADPAAPAVVKDAAMKVADKAIDDSAAAQKQALKMVGDEVNKAATTTTKPKSSSDKGIDATMIILALGAVMLLGRR